MANREIILRMRAETGQYEAGMKRSAAATKGVADAADATSRRAGGALSTLSGSIRDNRAAWDDLSSKAMIGGAAIVGGLGLAAKAAIDWESAWAGVAKTTDGTEAQMAQLEQGLRNLAKELPATHEEIAGVAEAAGQLGVAREDILGFTETAIALGASTNLSAEEAATSLAKFSNIMGTVSREGVEGYERLGSTLVELGNNGASTERDIMQMALRLAGAGKQIGATEADILAMANALSSVGIEAQLGGGAMSRGLLQMNSAVIEGGDELQKFAEISGMTASEFAAAWRRDPIAASNEFIAGLGRIGASGGDAAGALADVGLKGTQNAQVFLRAAGAVDVMTDSLKRGAPAWEANTALQEEATKRYETDAARIQTSLNRVKDAGISLGSSIAPIIASGAEKVAGLADAFGSLPGPVQSTITGIGAVAGATLLVGGASVKAIGGMQDLRDNLDSIGALSPRVDKGIRGASRALVGLTAAFTGLQIAGRVVAAFEGDLQRIGSQQLIRDLNTTSDSIGAIDAAIAKASNGKSDVVDLDSAMKAAFDPSWFESAFQGMDAAFSVFGLEKRGGIAQAKERFKELDETLAQMATSGNIEGAKAQFADIEERARQQGVSVKELAGVFPQYAEALAGADNASGGAAEGMRGIGEAAEEAEQATDDLADSISKLGDTLLNRRGSARDYQQTLFDLKQTIAENGATLDISTKAGRDNAAALDALAQSTTDYASKVLEETGSIEQAQGVLDRGRKQWEKYAAAAEMPQSEIKETADLLFTIPDEVKTEFKTTNSDIATGNAVALGKAVGQVPAEKDIEFSEFGTADTAGKVDILNRIIGAVPPSKTTLISEEGAVPSAKRITDMSMKVKDLQGKTVSVLEVGATGSRDRVLKLDGSIFGLHGKTVEVQEIGATASGDRVIRFKGEIYTLQGKTVDVGARVFGGAEVGALIGQIGQVRSKTATITVHGRRTGAAIGALAGGMWAGGITGEQPMAAGGVRVHGPGQVKPGIYGTSAAGIHMAEDTRSKWESYIPERRDLRPRAEAILAETARRFGKQVIPMAEGGVRQHVSRHYVAPAPRVTVQASAQQAPAPSGTSAAQIEAAITRAFAGVRITTSIGGRDFKGVIDRTTADRKGR